MIGVNDACAQQIEAQLADIEPRLHQSMRADTVADGLVSKGRQRPDVILLDVELLAVIESDAVEGVAVLSDDAPLVLLAPSDEVGAAELLRWNAQDYLVKGRTNGEGLERALRYAKERFRLARAQHLWERKFRRFLANSPDGVLVTTMKGDLRYRNSRAIEVLPVLNVGDPVAKVGIQVPAPSKDRVSLPDGRVLELHCSRIEWDDGPAWLLTFKDVTASVQLEDLKRRLSQSEKLAMMGQLAVGVAHEINNSIGFTFVNLSAALGHVHHLQDVAAGLDEALRASNGPASERAQALLDQAGPELFDEMREMLEENLDGMDRIRTIVKELRAFSRREDEERELVPVHDLVKSACRMLASQIKHVARLKTDLRDVDPVIGNRVKLVQILTNLLMNAVQSVPDDRSRGPALIEVGARKKGREVIIWVRDTGAGVPDDVRDRIFEPFFTTKPRDVGTGVGLSISAELARQHDGDLVLAETSPTGSTFELRLPATETVRTDHQTADVPRVRFDAHASRKRILLVDDEPNVRKSLMRMLREYDVTAAADGREAIDALEGQHFDALICDLVMPDLDGVDVHEALRTVRPELLDKVIYTSGGAYTPRTAAFVAQNDIMFIEKPIFPQRLFRALEDVFRAGSDSTNS